MLEGEGGFMMMFLVPDGIALASRVTESVSLRIKTGGSWVTTDTLRIERSGNKMFTKSW